MPLTLKCLKVSTGGQSGFSIVRGSSEHTGNQTRDSRLPGGDVSNCQLLFEHGCRRCRRASRCIHPVVPQSPLAFRGPSLAQGLPAF